MLLENINSNNSEENDDDDESFVVSVPQGAWPPRPNTPASTASEEGTSNLLPIVDELVVVK